MKKIFIYTALLATIIACNKLDNEPLQKADDPEANVKKITETVIGGPESSTKATIDADAKFAWTKDEDVIAVHVGGLGKTPKYVFSSGASANAKSAQFTVAYDEGYSRDAFAVYPSNIVTEFAECSDSKLDVTLPGSYTLDQLSGTKSPCPMIATNTPGSGWTFSHICGMLRLTVSAIPPEAKRLEIDFDGKKVWGPFSITSPDPGNSVISTTNDNDHDIIKITKDGTSDVTLNDDTWLDGLVLNIPLPVGTYTKITITAYNALSGGSVVFTKARSFNYTATRKKGTRRSIPALFSVSGSRQVFFSPGNLQATYDYDGETWTWAFAEHQYDRIGNGGGNKLITTSTKELTEPYAKLSGDGTVDLFGWSTGSTYYGIATSTNGDDFSGTFVDWGNISGLDGKPSGYWRTMTCGNESYYEWRYITLDRSTGVRVNSTDNARYTKAIINSSIKGLILFPNDYSGPSESTSDITWGTINGQKNDFGTTLNFDGWAVLELEGCVFLPAVGYRNGIDISDFNSKGFYAGSNNGAYTLQFQSSQIYWNMSVSKSRGRSVRLVHAIN